MKYVLVTIFFIIYSDVCLSQDTTTLNSKAPRASNSSLLAKADYEFEQKRFREALNLYTPQLVANGINANLNFKVALCQTYLLNNPKANIELLKKSISNYSDKYNFYNTRQTQAGIDALYFLGKNFMYTGQIDSGIQYLVYYQNLAHNNLLDAGRQLKMCINARQLMKSPRQLNIVLQSKPVNTDYDESRPVISLDNTTLFFASRRPDKDIGDGVLHDDDIYFAVADDKGVFGNVQPFSFNTEFDEEPVSLSSNGKTLYFRRTGKDGVGDIYSSEKQDDGKWSKPKKVRNINSGYDEQGMAISNDGKMLVLSSNRPGGMGGYDLYISNKKNGRWGKPKNMGSTVNTDLDEISPFVFPDGQRVYFSSNGNKQYGMGGFDIFFTYPDSTAKGWAIPFTMGYPVNTSGNEKDYVVGAQGLTFYTAVGKGGDLDIFQIIAGEFKPEIQDQVTEVVGTTETQTVAVVEVEKEKKVEVDKEIEVSKVQEVEKDVDKNVGFVSADDAQKLDKVIAVQQNEVEVQSVVESEKMVYTNQSQQQIDSLNGANPVETKKDDLGKTEEKQGNKAVGNGTSVNEGLDATDSKDDRAEKVLAGIDKEDRDALVKKIKDDITKEIKEKRNAVFKTFYFNFNSDEVELKKYELQILVDFLKEHRDVNIEVLGHTDNVGSWETNFWVSRQRAKSVYDYLAANKIARSRMIFNGKGAIDPVAPNNTSAGRAQNRRVEIILIE